MVAAAKSDRSDFTLVCPACGNQNENALFDWARTTGNDSVFLIPPSMSNFREKAERAVVVDWKAIAYRPDEMIEWFHRLEAINGGEGSLKNVSGTGLRDNSRYDSLSTEALRAVIRTYDVDYVVINRDTISEARAPSVVYENGDFLVFPTQNLK